jgi:hypothetical protein
MTRGVTKKTQRDDRLREKRAQVAQGWPTAATTPPKAIPSSLGVASPASKPR